MTLTLARWEAPAWYADAACRGHTAEMFPIDAHGTAIALHRYCQRCPVQAECLLYALEHHIRHGIWGGVSMHELRRMRRGHW